MNGIVMQYLNVQYLNVNYDVVHDFVLLAFAVQSVGVQHVGVNGVVVQDVGVNDDVVCPIYMINEVYSLNIQSVIIQNTTFDKIILDEPSPVSVDTNCACM